MSGNGSLSAGSLTMRCALGRAGLKADKREGDGATPIGCFPMRRVLYRRDRLQAAPTTGLACTAIGRDDGWCDEPEHSAYNRPVRLPFEGSHEKLWRADGLYDVIVILGHNDDPPKPGFGSAIFLHVARDDYEPTEGCIALAQADLLTLLARCGPATILEIRPD